MHVAEGRLDLVVGALGADQLLIRLDPHAMLVEAFHERADLEPHGLHPDGGVLRVQGHADPAGCQMVGRRHRHIAAGLVMHQHLAVERGHAGHHIPAAQHARVSLDPVGMRQPAGGDEHHIRCLLEDILPLGEMIQPDTHAKPVDLALQPVGDAKKVAPPVGLSGKQHLAAELGRRLEQNHLMSAFGADARRLHAGRPAADNDDLLPRRVRRRDHMRKLRLARGGRVLDAVAEVRAIGRADTVADAVLLAAFQLGDDIGIGDVAAGHADEIDNLLANGVARGGQIVDPRGVKDGQPDLAPEAARLFKEGRERGGHARHIACQPRQRVDAARHEIQEIDRAVVAKPRGDLDIVLFRQAGLVMVLLGHGHAHTKREIGAGGLAHGFEHHAAVTHAVVQRSAIAVGPLVGDRRPELVHQVAGCDDLQPVEPGLAADPGGGGEITDNAQDIGFVHGARKAAMQNLAIGRRRDDGKPVAGIGVGAPAEMGDLRHQRGAMPVIEIGKLGKEGNDVVVDDQLVEDRRGVGRDGARPADKGQADAAFRLFHLVAKRGVGRAARLRVAERMAGTEDPVFQPDRTKLECLQ